MGFNKLAFGFLSVGALTLSGSIAWAAAQQVEPEAVEPKIEVATEPKTEVTVEPKTEVATEPKAEVTAEPKTEVATEPKTEAATEPKTEVAAEPKTEAAAAPKTEVAAEPKITQRIEPKFAQSTEPNTVAQALAARQAERWPILGVMTDVGIPDGVNASLVVRPRKWIRGYAGGGTNTVAKGWRAGLSYIPFGSGPSCSMEYGSFAEGNANGIVGRLAGDTWESNAILERIGYRYANAHVGLDFGGKHFMFFVHGGISRVWSTVHNMDAVIRNNAKVTDPYVTGSTQVSVRQDPTIKATGSSLKVGLIVFLL